jgi:hypothetical protein
VRPPHLGQPHGQVRRQDVVRVEEHDDVPAGQHIATVEGHPLRSLLGQQHRDSVGIALDHARRAVRRAVVDDDDLHIVPSQRQRALDGGTDETLVVVVGDDDAQPLHRRLRTHGWLSLRADRSAFDREDGRRTAVVSLGPEGTPGRGRAAVLSGHHAAARAVSRPLAAD